MTIHFGLVVPAPADPGRYLRREVINRLGIWLRRRGIIWTALWTRENFVGLDREHVHLLVHVPRKAWGAFCAATQRWWPQPGAVDVRRVTNAERALRYLLKQLSPQARFAMGGLIHREGRCRFLPMKNNLGADQQGLSFRVESISIGTGTAPRLVFDSEPAAMTADEVLNGLRGADTKRSAVEEAKDFLLDTLAGGAMPACDVQAAAGAEGISRATLPRAKGVLRIETKKAGMTGPWQWMLPESAKVLRATEDAQPHAVSTFEENEHHREKSEPLAGKDGEHHEQ